MMWGGLNKYKSQRRHKGIRAVVSVRAGTMPTSQEREREIAASGTPLCLRLGQGCQGWEGREPLGAWSSVECGAITAYQINTRPHLTPRKHNCLILVFQSHRNIITSLSPVSRMEFINLWFLRDWEPMKVFALWSSSSSVSPIFSLSSQSSLHSVPGLIPRLEQNTEPANYFKNMLENAGEI